MQERFLEISADADQKQDQQFETWLSGEGIPFEPARPEGGILRIGHGAQIYPESASPYR